MKELRVQFLAFDGCPLAEAARESLERALEECGIKGYEEVDLLGPSASDELRTWGSPTILINGADAAGQRKGQGIGCRIYPGPDRVPDAASIVAALKTARR